MPVLSNWEDSLYYAVVSCFAPAFQVYPLPDHIIDNQPDFLKTRPPKSTMSALFTSAGTSRARTAVRERRRVLARASMMASNRLCPSCHGAHWSPGLGLGGAAPPDTKAALQLDWRPRRGGSHQRGPLWAHLHCRDQAGATLEVVHSAQCKSTLHCHSCWQDRFFTL